LRKMLLKCAKKYRFFYLFLANQIIKASFVLLFELSTVFSKWKYFLLSMFC
jgi:hypothetical protein